MNPQVLAILPMLYMLSHPMAGDTPRHMTPGARDWGKVSVVRNAIQRYAPNLADFSKFPRVGDERGDRSEIERFMIGSFALTPGQGQTIAKDIPVGDPWLSMAINLRGELNGAVGAAGTVVADAPTTLLKVALTTDLDKDVVEGGVSARALYRHAQFQYGTAGELVAPTVVASTVTPFNAVITIPFIDERLLVPEDTILDTRRYNTVSVTLTTGLLGDIVTGAANVTLQNVFADIEVMRLSPRVPLPLDVVKALAYYKQFAPMVPAGEVSFNLDRIPTLAYKRLYWMATSGASAGVAFTGTGSNAVIDTVKVASNRRDHFGSAIAPMSRRVLQHDNKLDYSVETWPTGWYVADFVRDRSALSALASGDLSVLQQIFAYQGGLPGTPQVSTFMSGLQKLRGERGR